MQILENCIGDQAEIKTKLQVSKKPPNSHVYIGLHVKVAVHAEIRSLKSIQDNIIKLTQEKHIVFEFPITKLKYVY